MKLRSATLSVAFAILGSRTGAAEPTCPDGFRYIASAQGCVPTDLCRDNGCGEPRSFTQCSMTALGKRECLCNTGFSVRTVDGNQECVAVPEAENQLKCFHPINWKSIARTYRTETGVKDAIACQKLCSRENACTHFNYHTDSHDCELKIKNGSDVVQAENVITGPKTCNSSCYKVGVGHSARDMATPGKMYSAYDCQSWCLDTIGCHYFTFNVETSTCYLKGAEAAGTERSSPSDVAGPKEFCRGGTEEAETESGTAGGSEGGAAAPEAEKQLKCFHPINWKSIARTYRTETGVKDAIACQKLCSRENACTHFNYHTDSHDCELKIKNGSDVVQAENVITGPKTCNSSCYKVGMGHTAPEMAKPGKMYSAYDCQSWCLDTIGCHYFTFNVETSTCYLKGAEAAGTERKYSGDVAGPKEFCRGGTEEAETESGTAGGSGGGAAAPEAEKQLKCFHPINWKSIARTYRTETGVKDAIACQKLCSRENACTHFNYHTDSHDCELKIKNGSDVVQAENVITGPKTCNSSCYKVGVGHSARDMATPGKMYSAYDCQSWCLDTIGCHYFTFNVETSTCYLKGAEAAGTERSSPSDVVGPKEFCRGGTEEAETESGTAGGSGGGAAAPEAEKQLKCFHPINWKSIARTYRTETGVKDAIACQKLCSRENACTHFNYHTDSHDCELKIKNGSDVVQAENVITGPKTCNSSCYKVGMGHTAPEMAKPGKMYSAYDCQSWCLDTIGCHYFTFNVETSTCYLKGAEAAGTERKYSGDVAGPKEFCRGGTEEAETESGTAGGSGGGAAAPEAEKQLKCFHPINWKSIARTYRTETGVKDAIACQKLCSRENACTHFNYHTDSHDCELKIKNGSDVVQAENVITGPKTCNSSCYKVGVGHSARDMATPGKMYSAYDCQSWCLDTIGCHYFTFNVETSTCYLKGAEAAGTERSSPSDVVGPKEFCRGGTEEAETESGTAGGSGGGAAAPEAEKQLKCFHPINWKSIARTYRTETGVKDAIACQKLCSRENACTHFNYHTDSHDCELKIKNGSDVVQAENVITGPKTCNSSCYKVGMGHTAPEMAKPGKMYSAYDCQSWCLDTIGCHYFTFNVETSFCYLKGAEAAGTERKYSGDVAGPKEFCRGGTEEAETESGTAGGSGGGAAAPEAEKQLKCFHPINWKSIARTYRTETGVKDAIACQKLCSRENACTHFNYHTDSHDCELKIKNGSDVVQAENVITGPKTCNSSCYKVGMGHTAPEMAKPGKMYSAYDCQSWCLDTIGCHYFTFNVETSTCYLKGAEAAGTERKYSGDVAGPKEFCRGGTEEAETESGTAGGSGGGAAAPEAEKQLKCFHPINWKSIARTYRTETGVKDAIACQKLCSRENACTHFNYHTDSHDCELKIKNGSDVVQAENVITGPKTCNSSCYKVGVGHSARDMATPGKMYSAYDCQSWCLDTIGCHYFTFNVETSTCYLKGAEAAGTERSSPSDVVGPKEFCRGGTEEAETESGTAGGSEGGAAAPEAEKQLKCFHPINWKSIARTYRTETGVKDAIACQKLCSRENACTHFNYHTDSHDCELKIKNGSDVVQAENVITGPKTCNSSCYKVGMGHTAPDMAKPGQMYSAYDCQSWCLDTIGCHYFTFNVETSFCYLKGAEAAGTERKYSGDVVGPKEFCRGGTEEAETESGTAGGSGGGALQPGAGENPGAGEVENGGNSEEEDLDNGENTEEGLGSVEDTEGGDNDSAGSSENDITTFDEPVPTAPKVDFIDQAIIKVSARAAPSRTQVQISECFTVSFDRMEKTVTVASGSTSHSGKMAGAPSPTGGFVSLFYHDGQNLAVVYDYQLDSGDYGNVTVKVPFAECGLDTVNILKKSDDASFEGLRAFVTRDLKRSMTA